jgi:hypothetical protein
MKGWFHWTTQKRVVDALERFAERVSGRGRIALDPCSNAASKTGALLELWGTDETAMVPYRQRVEHVIAHSHAAHETMGTFRFEPKWARSVHEDEREAIIADAARAGLDSDLAQIVESNEAILREACARGLGTDIRALAAALLDAPYGRSVRLADGLAADWLELAAGGLVYSNPPFGGGVVDLWAKKMADEGARGAEVVGMVANATAARWFHREVFGRAQALLFFAGRLSFENAPPDTRGEGASVQNVLPYWGEHIGDFIDVFQEFGEVVIPQPRRRRAAEPIEEQPEPEEVADAA